MHSLRNDDRMHAYLALGLSVLLGVAFINTTAYLYQQMAMPFDMTGTSALLYAVTGAHLVMTFVGLLFLVVMGFQALGGQLTGHDAEGMGAAALYWYVTVAVYLARLVRDLHHQVARQPLDVHHRIQVVLRPRARQPRARLRLRLDHRRHGLGPVTAGYKGGVGDHLGYGLLLAIAAGSVFLGLVAVAFRDASPSAQAELAGTDVAPPVAPPAHPAYWPVLGAFGATSVVLGLVVVERDVRRSASSCSSPCSSSGWCWPGAIGPPATPRRTGSCATA